MERIAPIGQPVKERLFTLPASLKSWSGEAIAIDDYDSVGHYYLLIMVTHLPRWMAGQIFHERPVCDLIQMVSPIILA